MTVRKSGVGAAAALEEATKYMLEADGADVLSINKARYESLMKAAIEARSRTAPADRVLSAEVAQYLFWETRLLDGRHYRDWLALLSPDFVYWVPSHPSGGDPVAQSAINFDDRRRIIDRIALIETGAFVSQLPHSRTSRMISNVEAWPNADGSIDVRSNTVIYEHRRGRTLSFTGWQTHQLVSGGERWLIRNKVINLLDCDLPQGNVTFIL